MSDRVRIIAREIMARGFGLLEKITVQRRRSTGETQTLTRDIFDTGDGVTLLPYDRERGTIILIRQFRAVAFLKDGTEAIIEACAASSKARTPSRVSSRKPKRRPASSYRGHHASSSKPI